MNQFRNKNQIKTEVLSEGNDSNEKEVFISSQFLRFRISWV